MDAPRYVNYGELHSDATNTHKHWMIVAREGELVVRYGRSKGTSYAGMDARCVELYRKPAMGRKDAIPAANWATGNRCVDEAVDRASGKASDGYRMVADVHLGWTPPQDPASRRAPVKAKEPEPAVAELPPQTRSEKYCQGF